eukprot:Opistho-2@18691
MSAPGPLVDGSSQSASPPNDARRNLTSVTRIKKSTAEKMFTEDMDRCFLELLLERKEAIRNKNTGVGFWDSLSKQIAERNTRLIREGRMDPPGWPTKQGRQLRDHWDYLVKKWKYALANQGKIGRGKRDLFPFTAEVSEVKGVDCPPFSLSTDAPALAPGLRAPPATQHAASGPHTAGGEESRDEISDIGTNAHNPQHHAAHVPDALPATHHAGAEGTANGGASAKRKRTTAASGAAAAVDVSAPGASASAGADGEVDGAGVERILAYMRKRDRREDKRWKNEAKRRKMDEEKQSESQKQLLDAMGLLVKALEDSAQKHPAVVDKAKDAMASATAR